MLCVLPGNVVEWRMPEDIDLEGIEFKAMASGSHTLKTDFVYVKILSYILYYPMKTFNTFTRLCLWYFFTSFFTLRGQLSCSKFTGGTHRVLLKSIETLPCFFNSLQVVF